MTKEMTKKERTFLFVGEDGKHIEWVQTKEDKAKAKKELDEFKKKLGLDKPLAELEKLNNKNKHKPVSLYCLCCGVKITDNYDGAVWSYTHICNKDYIEKRAMTNMCTALGSIEHGALMPTSLVLFKQFKDRKCKCRTKKEHLERTEKEYLGKRWKTFEIKDKKVLALQKEFLKTIEHAVNGGFGPRL